MAKLYNLARMTTATTGTGTITLGSAVSGYLTFALAGVANADIVSYGIKDGANSEVGTGTYTSAGTTLTRTVTASTNANAAISLSGTAEVFITPRKEDVANLNESNVFTAFPVQAGSPANTESDPAYVITRNVDNTGSGNAHGFGDVANISRTTGGPIGYNSFDGRVTISGTGSFDHYAGHQSLPTFSTSGTISLYHGTFSGGVITAGTVTNAYLHHAADMTGAGAVTNLYGFYADSLVKGATLNYAFYSAGTTPSKFGGNVDVNGLSVAGTDATGAWTAWTPTITSTAGAITTSSSKAFYKKVGKTVAFSAQLTITTNGTGTGFIQFTLPFTTATHANNLQPGFAGIKSGVLSLAVIGALGSTTCTIAKYDGTYPAASGDALYISGTYETD